MRLDCVRQREGWVHHAQTAWIHVFLWYLAQTILWEKNNADATKFVDSLLRILKTEEENDKIIFLSEFPL